MGAGPPMVPPLRRGDGRGAGEYGVESGTR